MTPRVDITINNIQVAIRRDEEANVFVGYCPRFRVYSQGETKDEAFEATASAVTLRLGTAFEHGRIDTVLRQAGFERYADGFRPSENEEFVSIEFKEGIEVREVGIRVPIGALLGSRSAECPH